MLRTRFRGVRGPFRIAQRVLFNIVLEVIVRRIGIDTKGTIFTKSVQLLGFANDIDIIARNVATVKETESRSHADGAGHEYDENKIHERKGVKK